MEFEKVRKEHILKAIKDYQEKGLPKGFGPSSTYDIYYKDESYPPKAIMAYANYHATGEKIKATFKGGIGTDCFNVLEREGFVIKSKKDQLIELLDKGMVSLIQEFIKQADEGGLKTSAYPKNYLKLKLKVSFGQGVAARIPWIGLYKEPNTIQKGIYPVFLYYKEYKKLVLAYGISETEKVDYNWSNTEELKSIEQWHLEEFNKKPDRYGSSFIKGIYDTTKELDEETLSKDLEELIGMYDDIDFQIDNDLKEFEERIRSNTAISNGVFFKVLDRLINDLEIQNSEKIVFSTGSNQLTFQVGKRYCLLLKKNKFGFINPIESNINELKRGKFSKPDPATFFRESSSEVFLKNYESIKESVAFELRRDNHVKDKEYDNKIFRKYVFDKNYRNKFNNIETDEINIDLKKKTMSTEIPLNQIFYGPPGTGKTFNTINNALKIIDPEFYELNRANRENLKEQFNEYVKKGNIVFTTFHQSMSYEDFIEGIKPVISNENNSNELEYEIQDGILKELVSNIIGNTNYSSKSSNDIVIDEEKFKNNVNKVSLGNSNESEDEAIYQYCLKNNCIALGFGEDIDFSGVKNRNDIRERYKKNGIEISSPMDFNISSIERLVLWMEKGQLVFISNGNKSLRAIGVVSGGYYCDNTTPIKYSQFREVKWLYVDIDLPIKQIYGSYFSQQSIYQMSGNKFDLSYFTKSEIKERSSEKYVLVVDEINRGNVSSIFGELITLLEEDKRKGNKEELEVTLPYSKEPFSIPNNLHIIGTMNTADRSVEALDTALRRRFSFVEMMPNVSLLESKEINGINLKDVLSTINDRIEILIDRDHTIGHSYFMNINNSKELKLAFKDKIVPLLQEYFYGDYGKIGLVLGNGFVKSHSKSKNPFAGFKYEGKEELNRDFYDLVAIDDTFDIINALKNLLNKNNDNQD